MERISLSNGLSIPLMGFGTFPLNGDVLKNSLKEAVFDGYGLVDTAVGYGNNDTIGELVSSSSNILKDSFISTKIDAYTLREMALFGPFKRFKGRKELNFLIKQHHIEKAIQLSFDKLHRIDIMLLHAPFKGCINVYDAIVKLYDDKKIKAYGVSNFDINELYLLYKERGSYPMINQTEISPYNSQKELVKYCREHNIVVEAYSPFGRGKLVNEFMHHPVLNEIASRYKKTVGQIILRWIVQQGIVAIVRSQNPQRIKSNSEIFDFSLLDADMELIDSMNKNMVLGVNQVGKKTIKKL